MASWSLSAVLANKRCRAEQSVTSHRSWWPLNNLFRLVYSLNGCPIADFSGISWSWKIRPFIGKSTIPLSIYCALPHNTTHISRAKTYPRLFRTPVLVAIALIETGMDPLEAVALIRKHRKGAVNKVQLAYLQKYKAHSKKKCTIMWNIVSIMLYYTFYLFSFCVSPQNFGVQTAIVFFAFVCLLVFSMQTQNTLSHNSTPLVSHTTQHNILQTCFISLLSHPKPSPRCWSTSRSSQSPPDLDDDYLSIFGYFIY